MCNFTRVWNHKFQPRKHLGLWGSSGFFGGPVDFLIHWPPGPVVATVQCQGLCSVCTVAPMTNSRTWRNWKWRGWRCVADTYWETMWEIITPETEGREYHRGAGKQDWGSLDTWRERQRICQKSNTGGGANWEKKRKTKANMDAVSKNDKVDHLFVYQNIIKIIEFVCFKVILRGGYFCIYELFQLSPFSTSWGYI